MRSHGRFPDAISIGPHFVSGWSSRSLGSDIVGFFLYIMIGTVSTDRHIILQWEAFQAFLQYLQITKAR